MDEKFLIPMSKPNFGKDEEDALIDVLKSDWPSQGKITEEFELRLSEYLSSDVIVVNNGSSAIICALLSNGFKPGDKVVVPAFTFVATSSIPKILGAEILVADVNPETLNINVDAVEKLVKHNDVKFVIVVDVGGLPVDIEAFIELSKRYKFILIEDAAQAFGAEYKKKKLGSFSHTTIFSFQITKQLSTVEGGCIATTNKDVLEKISKIKDYGRNKTELYVHDVLGSNFRTTDLQSALGIIQLKKVEHHIKRRNDIAKLYKDNIRDLSFQKIPNYVSRHSYMIFFALTENEERRNNYITKLNEGKIDVRRTWLPIHLQPCNKELNRSNCINAEKIFESTFTIPLYNSMSFNDAQIIIDLCNKE